MITKIGDKQSVMKPCESKTGGAKIKALSSLRLALLFL
ncbi:MAG: hypothetical protein AVDCRST_MAG74-3202 [uncultured Pyrinomonadaceae bacterium]|uniref:Uncharacterized protein n=1 Tax=uncultured Pyrinomonadaceae bacterium TaxID=2283094 RepID=A0A6J4PU59_9BACT|nr:MAG: hypothetical protein AVDCRST_MAG74-3202 [uncultured Pyrinomonadaceae bacterium]